MKFRSLNINEVQVKIQSIKQGNGAILTLYKDARADMTILDDTIGCMNWKKEHEGNVCKVSIWCDKRGMWVTKSDVGECIDHNGVINEKGQASDAFKRACFNWGIGRELYTAPFIWIKGTVNKFDKYKVTVFKVENGQITGLQIINDKKEVVYQYYPAGEKPVIQQVPTPAPKQEPEKEKETKFDRAIAIKVISSKGTQYQIESQLKYHVINNLDEANDNQLRMIYAYIKKGLKATKQA
ncbi:MAG: hypothetical protein ACRCZ0_05665 [Cetobacterium sp.]